MVSNRTLIIECGARRVALAAFSNAGHRLRLHKFAAEPFGHQADAPAAGDDPWLKNTCDGLLSLARQTGMRGPVTLVLPAHLTLAKAIKLPRVETVQREKILHFEAGQAIPYALSDVVWDSVAVFETATDLEVLLATAKLEVLDPLCSAAYDAGFEPNLILPSSFATLAGFRLLQDFPGQGFLGLNLGMRSTTLVLFESGRFAFRTFALGLGESEGPAGPQPATEKADAVRARLLQEITRSLLHFQWRSGMGKPNHVCLTGEGAQVAGLAEAVAAKLKIPVEVSGGLKAVDITDESVRKNASEHALALIDLIGAATIRFRSDQPMVNLLPPQARRRINYHQRRPWFVAASLLTAAILIPPLIHFRSVRDEAQRKSIAIERELAPFRTRDLLNQKNLELLADLKRRMIVIESIRTHRANWLRLLAGVQDRLGMVEDVWLEKLQIAPGAADAPLKLMLSGRMLDRAHPLSKVSPETFSRVKALLTQLTAMPFVTAVEAERFDNQRPGILKFDFVLVGDVKQPL